MKFYTETNITIEIDLFTDLSTGTDPKISYSGPSGNKGEWTATISGTKLIYTTSTSDITVAGVWRFQPIITLDGDLLKGEIVRQVIYRSLVD